ncbi:MAG: T9SS type A sorting domain-containing protein, partial [Dehalococcoidia bacterium]|nr:T9SS type A sorting domain-containing protein [Dehalococcoidia bacterium]
SCPCTLLPLENFNNATGWTMMGLWHVDSGLACVTCASLFDKYAYFGKAGGCSYETGSRVLGELRSPMIEIPDCVEAIVIEFDQFRHVEYYSEAYDRTWLEVSFDGATWETLWYRDASFMSPDISPESHIQKVRNVPAEASQMWIRFQFDSVDRFYNDFPGWAIDNVEVLNADCVAGAPPAPAAMVVVPKAAPRDQISVTNSPNPITDVHTTVFTVRGAGVEAMKIQIFDLSGALVYEEEVAGNELVWHTDSNHGEYLANGVYLYRALIKVGGSWITTSTQKLVILR